MTRRARVSSKIKQERKKSFFYREISQLIAQLSHDEPDLFTIYPTRVELSSGEGICYVYFIARGGKKEFDKALEILKLYKPSLRAALAKARQGRHTPNLMFIYDEPFEKGRRVQELLDKIKQKELEADEKKQ